MHIFLFGKGFLGEYLSIFLGKSFKTTLLSLKNTKLKYFEEIISTLDHNSIVKLPNNKTCTVKDFTKDMNARYERANKLYL